VTLPAFAAERRAAATCCSAAAAGRLAAAALSIDISYPHDSQQQTRRTPRLRSNDETTGDGRSTVSWTLLRMLCQQCQKV